MRADRLLSLLMLLQRNGRMSAKELAEHLEVSERTIYRDVDSLSATGVPIFAETGRGGGFDLLDSYRTNLTGLTEREVRAFFMLNIPAPLNELGVKQDLQTALLKVSAALPHSYQVDEQHVRQRFHLDSTWWHQLEEPVPFLQTIEQAVWNDQQLKIRYRPLFVLELEHIVDAYGLVAKAGVWHLVCAREGRVRVHRVAHLQDVQATGEVFSRPQDFDLAAFWESWCVEQENYTTNFPVRVKVAERVVPLLPFHFGERIREKIAKAGPADRDGWIVLELTFESLDAAREKLLSFGSSLQVLEPLALRMSIIDYAKQTLKLYEGD